MKENPAEKHKVKPKIMGHYPAPKCSTKYWGFLGKKKEWRLELTIEVRNQRANTAYVLKISVYTYKL